MIGKDERDTGPAGSAKDPRRGELLTTLASVAMILLLLFSAAGEVAASQRGSGDLALVVERADGSVQIVETSGNTSLQRVEGLGDLSHASAVFSRDQRYAFVFGRDGGLTKVDLLEGRVIGRVIQSGNSIGGAISQDGRWVAVANYEPGGVKIFDSGDLRLVADIPAEYGDGRRSKVIGLVDAPGPRFVFSLWVAGEIWLVDVSDIETPRVQRFTGIGRNPYDALITPDGRYYLAGLFGEDGLALLDLWRPEQGVRRILPGYGRGEEPLPVFKMPHLEGWAVAGDLAFVPAIGRHEVLVVDMRTWEEIVQTLTPGKGVLHMEFEPRGEEVWMSVRDRDELHVYDTRTFERRATLPAAKPSGIFMTARAGRIGL